MLASFQSAETSSDSQKLWQVVERVQLQCQLTPSVLWSQSHQAPWTYECWADTTVTLQYLWIQMESHCFPSYGLQLWEPGSPRSVVTIKTEVKKALNASTCFSSVLVRWASSPNFSPMFSFDISSYYIIFLPIFLREGSHYSWVCKTLLNFNLNFKQYGSWWPAIGLQTGYWRNHIIWESASGRIIGASGSSWLLVRL